MQGENAEVEFHVLWAAHRRGTCTHQYEVRVRSGAHAITHKERGRHGRAYTVACQALRVCTQQWPHLPWLTSTVGAASSALRAFSVSVLALRVDTAADSFYKAICDNRQRDEEGEDEREQPQ